MHTYAATHRALVPVDARGDNAAELQGRLRAERVGERLLVKLARLEDRHVGPADQQEEEAQVAPGGQLVFEARCSSSLG